MSCLGVHFALTGDQEKKLLSLPPGDERIAYLQEDVEKAWDEEFLAQSDKAWDSIHRVLTGYPPELGEGFDSERVAEFGTEGERLAIMGGVSLHDGDDYIITFIDATKVPLVAEATAALDEAQFAERYHRFCKGVYPEYGDEDLEYTWAYFQDVRDFFQRAAKAGRSVIFTADQ